MCNFRKISGHVYHIENQNGFNNALYDYFEASDDVKDNSYSKKKIREMVQNYPQSYPTYFVVIDQSFESGRVYIETFDLNLIV